jgi:hypothetical protein
LGIERDPDGRLVFPPEVVVQVKALVCELPYESGIPLSRFSYRELAVEVVRPGDRCIDQRHDHVALSE